MCYDPHHLGLVAEGDLGSGFLGQRDDGQKNVQEDSDAQAGTFLFDWSLLTWRCDVQSAGVEQHPHAPLGDNVD